VTQQRLAGRPPTRPTAASIRTLVRDLAYVQWDPVSIVAPSHLLSLWARLGAFRPSDLERLLWKEKSLFLHWTPMASIVATEDYPLYRSLMRRYPASLSHSWGSHRTRARKFLASRVGLRKKLLDGLRSGPRRLGEFEEHRRAKKSDVDWAPTSDVAQMLYHLTMSGDVMVVGHAGNQNLWGLTETFLPASVDRTELSESEFERAAAQRAIRVLGTATPTEITHHFVRGRYEHLGKTLASLEEEGTIRRVRVEELGARDERYVHASDVDRLDDLEGAEWEPRLSLLPPFDNLLASTARTSRLFGFEYVREQFLPKERRRFGTYVLPILWGDRLIGRIDPRLDRASGELVIQSVHAEPRAPTDPEVAARIGETIDRLAEFVGARAATYTGRVPPAWRRSLR